METEEFQKGIEGLLGVAAEAGPTAITRGSSLVALPSLACLGLPQSARGGSAARSWRKQSRAASVHISGADCEGRIELCSRFVVVAAVFNGRPCATVLV